ncbi:NTP pyrophosphohydrolase [Streptomyces sp. NBC_00400]|uniref:NTP pyrophosphohydrolase n=1 Tax=Streptomyces sp. NBC_00400 TaxID=2975737 RepID=UPI002E23E53F
MESLLIVDAANVVGSVPDGWWRDRRGAAERLRDALSGYAGTGLPGLVAPPVELVLVVEGAARGVESAEGVRVVAASGSGDDRIVQLVAEECGDRDCLVVTADRELRARVQALGARVTGPRAVRGRGRGEA